MGFKDINGDLPEEDFWMRHRHLFGNGVYQDPRLNWENQNSVLRQEEMVSGILVHVELF